MSKSNIVSQENQLSLEVETIFASNISNFVWYYDSDVTATVFRKRCLLCNQDNILWTNQAPHKYWQMELDGGKDAFGPKTKFGWFKCCCTSLNWFQVAMMATTGAKRRRLWQGSIVQTHTSLPHTDTNTNTRSMIMFLKCCTWTSGNAIANVKFDWRRGARQTKRCQKFGETFGTICWRLEEQCGGALAEGWRRIALSPINGARLFKCSALHCSPQIDWNGQGWFLYVVQNYVNKYVK